LGHALHHYTGNLHLPQQRFTNPDGSQIIDPPPISPSHHYHYTQLPDNLNSLDRNGGGPLSTFSAARQQKTPPKYYDGYYLFNKDLEGGGFLSEIIFAGSFVAPIFFLIP